MGGVIFLRSQIPNADSRLQRYVDIIKEKKKSLFDNSME